MPLDGPRAASLIAVAAFDADSWFFAMDDGSLGFGWLCQPLPGGG